MVHRVGRALTEGIAASFVPVKEPVVPLLNADGGEHGVPEIAVAAGTGELCQRLVAEAANPQGDVLWGGGADTLAAYNDYFEPYVCANDEFIGEAYKDPNGYWIGESPLPMVFIYNKTMLDEADVPTTWGGLCNENLKGKIAYCSPSKSGSAYTQLCTMLFC